MRSPPRARRGPARAIADGRFKDEIVPVPVPQRKGDPVVFDTDEYPRAGHDRREARRAEAGVQEGRHGDRRQRVGHQRRRRRAGRRRPRRRRRRWERKPLARILAYVSTGVDPKVMGIGPVPAVRKVLERAGLKIGDIDLFELNEAFAAQSVAVVARARARSREGQRQRRRDRARPSDRRQRRARADDARLCAARAGSCATASRRCASAAGMGIAMAVGSVVKSESECVRSRDAIVAHAREAAPAECCGLLLGARRRDRRGGARPATSPAIRRHDS